MIEVSERAATVLRETVGKAEGQSKKVRLSFDASG
jgi:hypothetical protein